MKQGGINRDIYLKIIRRSLLIFGLGLFLAMFPFYSFAKGEWIDLSHVRIMGVLQRIAVCYLFAALIFLHTNWKQQTIIAVVLLLVYWALMTLINVPGCEITAFDDKACNLAAYIDRTILTENHIWKQSKVFDPGRTFKHHSGNCHDACRHFMRTLAQTRKGRQRKSCRVILFRNGFNNYRLGVELLVSAQQSTLDKFVCLLHCRISLVFSRFLLLAD